MPNSSIDWATLGKQSIHPTKVEILEYLDHVDVDKASPKEMSNALGIDLGTVSYHVACLKKAGHLELVDTAQRRGAVEHYYRLVGDRG